MCGMMKQGHQLTKNAEGTYTCHSCLWTWRNVPQSDCPGLPRYPYGGWPPSLYTATQLRRLKRQPVSDPVGCYLIRKKPYKRYLYDIHQSVPRRVPTERQREAILKMREALAQKSTCKRCHTYYRGHSEKRSRVIQGYCETCREIIRVHQQQEKVCGWAMSYIRSPESWVILDTETTGLGDQDEVIEIALVSGSGSVLFSSLIQPQDPHRCDLASHIHGIDSSKLANAPTLREIWPTIQTILRRYRRVVAYNAAFDKRLLEATASRYDYRLAGVVWDCLMEAYAVYHGEWQNCFHSYRWQPLQVACDCLGIHESMPFHRAKADALRALAVLRALALRYEPGGEAEI